MPKQAIRTALLSRRRQLDADRCLTLSLRIQQRFLQLPEYASATTIGLYHAVRNEVATEEILRRAAVEGKEVAFPRVRGGALEFVRHSTAVPLLPGVFGIPEPQGGEAVPLQAIDLLILPGVGFDLQGHRLGYGKGFYDRALHADRRPGLLAGFCFEQQIVEALPAQAHDVPVDLLVTEERTLRFSRSSPGEDTKLHVKGGP